MLPRWQDEAADALNILDRLRALEDDDEGEA